MEVAVTLHKQLHLSLLKTKAIYTHFLKSEYLWYDKVPDVDYSVYTNPTDMIEGLRYETLDKWSYAETYQEYEDGVNHVTQGFGMYTTNNAQIFHIVIDSPAEKAGLKRGDIIEEINTQPAQYSDYLEAEKILM